MWTWASPLKILTSHIMQSCLRQTCALITVKIGRMGLPSFLLFEKGEGFDEVGEGLPWSWSNFRVPQVGDVFPSSMPVSWRGKHQMRNQSQQTSDRSSGGGQPSALLLTSVVLSLPLLQPPIHLRHKYPLTHQDSVPWNQCFPVLENCIVYNANCGFCLPRCSLSPVCHFKSWRPWRGICFASRKTPYQPTAVKEIEK